MSIEWLILKTGHLLLGTRGVARPDGSLRGSWRDDVHTNAARREIARKRARECANAGLGGCIRRITGLAQRADDRAVQDDRSAVIEIRQRVFHGEEDRGQIDVDDLAKEIFGGLSRRSVAGDARVREHNVELAELVSGFFKSRLARGRIRDLHLDRVGLGAEQFQRVQRLLVASSQ